MSVNILQGLLNTTALVVAGVYVAVIPPALANLNGVPTNVAGIVGTASFGPVNTPTAVSDYASYTAVYGPLINRLHDAGTVVAVCAQQGANAFQAVRVTDGSDTAALVQIGVANSTFALLLAARYTGSAGNNFSMQIRGSAIPNCLQVVLTSNLGVPEVFDGITKASPAAFWSALANAINTGVSVARGRSLYFTASVGTNTTFPIPAVGSSGATVTLSGGTDGAAGVTDLMLVGADGVGAARTGMYALRATGTSVATLADATSPASFGTQAAFGISEGIYMIGSGPAGDNIANAVSVFQASGAASTSFKYMFGDWTYWTDTVNGLTRLVSPASFVVGRLANLLPQYSTLNQQIYAVAGTQATTNGVTYSNLDLATLEQAGIDVVITPSPGGQPFYACASGHNSSPFGVATWNDSYTRMTNYIAATIAKGGSGAFIGQPITPALLVQEKAVLDMFMREMVKANMIQAFRNTITSSPSQQQAGITKVTSQVQYLAINEKFVVELQGGQTVSIQKQSGGPGQ